MNKGDDEILGIDGIRDRYSRTCSCCICSSIDPTDDDCEDMLARWVAMLLMDCCTDDGGALVCISGTEAIGIRGDVANRFHTDHNSLCLPSSSEAASSSKHCILHALTVLSNSLFAVLPSPLVDVVH